MSVNFPNSLDDSSTLPNPTAQDSMRQVPHAELHTAENEAIISAQKKIGSGDSVPAANKVLLGDGDGTSVWSDQVPESSINGLVNDLTSKANSADLANVATSGSYNDLVNKPTIPTTFDDLTDGTTNKAFTSSDETKLNGIAAGAEVNVQSDWSQSTSSADDFIKNKPNLSAVATSGSYTDLANNPTIDGLLPDQTGKSDYVLTSDGVNANWGLPSGGGSGSGANLTTTVTPTTVQVNSDTGTDALINSADSTNAGILTSADKVRLDAAATLTGTEVLTNKNLTSATNTFPTLNQSTTGNAATATKLATPRAINGTNFDGSAAINIPSVKWNAVTTTAQTAAINNGYIANNAALVTITLPATFAVGTTVRVAGLGAGGWKIAQPAGDNIVFGNVGTTAGTAGYLASTNQYDAVELLCVVANTTWAVVSSQGNIGVV